MGVEAVRLLFWQALRGASTMHLEEGGKRGSLAPRRPSALEDSGPRKTPLSSPPSPRPEKTAGLHLHYESSKTSNTYPSSQPGLSKSSKPASVFKANTTNANFTNAVNAAHAPRTG